MPPPPTLTSAPLELITAVPTTEPDIELRQVVPSNYYITLSITRDYTTYTTTLLLAGTEPAATPSSSVSEVDNVAATSTTAIVSPATTTTTAITNPATITITATANPATTTAFVPAAQTTTSIIAAGSTDPSNGTVIGAIVGAIAGSIVFVLLLWICFYTPIFRIEASTVSGSTRSSRSSESSAKRTTRRVRVTETRRTRVRELDDD